MKKLKRFLVVFFLMIAAFAVYVEIINRNSKNMTYRQKVLKAVYPALMWITKLTGTNHKKITNENTAPPISFYSLTATTIDGNTLNFDSLRGKKVLLVNTASNCGYTRQYEALQKLSELYKDRLVVLGFPSNDFKQQEKGTEAEIAGFCRNNFGVTFPLMQKSMVTSTDGQNPVYQWLTDAAKNGWNNKKPDWNFSKYLVNERGILTHYFGPSVSPLDTDILNAIQ